MNKIYIFTCDNNLFILNCCIEMINKYYIPNPQIIVLGFKIPEIKYNNVLFYQLDIKQDINLWSMYIYKFFNNINDEYILTLFEDQFPINTINVEGINYILNYMKKNKNCSYCTLCDQPSFGRDTNEEIICNNNNLFLFKRNLKCKLKICLQVNLWNKNYFLKYLKNNLNPWKFEIEMSKLAINDNYYALSTSNYNISINCVFPSLINTALSQSNWPNKVSIICMKLNDINYLIENNYLNKNNLIFGSYNYYIDFKDIN